ncbi:hypothetical protein [Marinimicrobium sp. LS-A18]|uniref:hypothetical protein n=1 Tax=Marinimicrobium sp. LS-A18 TaxID=1381596 RepID=UPI00046408D3|nr:hypothetical protein [Marinimicrobium sp. LS-A18]
MTTCTVYRWLPTFRRFTPWLMLSVIFAYNFSHAKGTLDASIRIDSAHSDNARKASENPVSERQDEASLQIGGEYENSILQLTGGYQASERRFDKGSQEDRSLLEGSGELTVGKPYHPADLVLRHSRRMVLNAPDELDLISNNDEREIVSAIPRIRWQLTGADLLMAQGNLTAVEYRFRPERDSTRSGGSLIWLRDLSQTDQLRWTAQISDVEFDAVPSADYRYESLDAAYLVDLQRLSYQVQVGYNQTESQQDDGFGSPTYHLQATYEAGLSEWELSVQRFITDNSTGDGNVGDFGGFDPGDSSAGNLDQLERTRAQLRWQGEQLCERCTLSLSIYHQSDDYRVETEDRSERGGRIGFGYALSRRATLDVSWHRREHRFEEVVARSDYQQETLYGGIAYRFASGLECDLYVREEDRRSDQGGRGYAETRGGIGIGYTF